jgi:hypothetical protein
MMGVTTNSKTAHSVSFNAAEWRGAAELPKSAPPVLQNAQFVLPGVPGFGVQLNAAAMEPRHLMD